MSPIQGWISIAIGRRWRHRSSRRRSRGAQGDSLTLLVAGRRHAGREVRVPAAHRDRVLGRGDRGWPLRACAGAWRRGDDHAAVLREAIRVTHGYDPCVTRFYDLDEADALVPELQTRCARLRDQREDLIAIRDELAIGEASLEGAAASGGGSGGTLPDKDDDIRRLRLRMRGLVDQMQAEVAWLDERSVQLRDIPSGLLDVAALVSGRQVWLCWRLGEERFDHWHELTTGFAGRRPIAELA